MLKTCKACKTEKPVTEFYRNSGVAGYRSECKPCYNAVRLAAYHAIDKFKPGFRERQEATAKLYRAANKEKIAKTKKAIFDRRDKALYNAEQKARRHKKYIDNPALHEASKQYAREYFRKNRAKFYQNARKWNENNRQRRAEIVSKWARTNPEKVRQIAREWERANPEKVQAKKRNRHAAERGSEGIHTAADWAYLLKSYKYKCACCGRRTKLTADHIVPVSKGGSNKIENIQPLCLRCNSAKGNRHSTKYQASDLCSLAAQRSLFEEEPPSVATAESASHGPTGT